jgi:hypothetical protein
VLAEHWRPANVRAAERKTFRIIGLEWLPIWPSWLQTGEQAKGCDADRFEQAIQARSKALVNVLA